MNEAAQKARDKYRLHGITLLHQHCLHLRTRNTRIKRVQDHHIRRLLFCEHLYRLKICICKLSTNYRKFFDIHSKRFRVVGKKSHLGIREITALPFLQRVGIKTKTSPCFESARSAKNPKNPPARNPANADSRVKCG